MGLLLVLLVGFLAGTVAFVVERHRKGEIKTGIVPSAELLEHANEFRRFQQMLMQAERSASPSPVTSVFRMKSGVAIILSMVKANKE